MPNFEKPSTFLTEVFLSRKLKTRIFLHVIFWLFYLLFLYVSLHIDSRLNNGQQEFFSYHFPFYFYDIASTYLFIYVIIEKLLYKKRFFLFIISLIVWAVFIYVLERTTIYYKSVYIFKTLKKEDFIFFVDVFSNIMHIFTIPIFAMLVNIARKLIRESQLRMEAEKQRLESEVNLLHAQMNPHFLFNTLNNIDHLIFKDPKRASTALTQVSELFRYMLYLSKEKLVPIEKEINYIISLVELYNLRIANNNFFDFQYTETCCGQLIPPMLFMAFIENAYKHGKKNVGSPGVSIILACNKGIIQFFCTNAIEKENLSKDSVGGIGLKNVSRRLELLFPDKHILKIEIIDQNYNVFLEINTNN